MKNNESTQLRVSFYVFFTFPFPSSWRNLGKLKWFAKRAIGEAITEGVVWQCQMKFSSKNLLATKKFVLATKSINLGASWPQGFFSKVKPWKVKVIFSPFPSSSFLISLCICDFALMCNSCPLLAVRFSSAVCTAWLGGWLNGRTSCWLASSLSVGDFYEKSRLSKWLKSVKTEKGNVACRLAWTGLCSGSAWLPLDFFH